MTSSAAHCVTSSGKYVVFHIDARYFNEITRKSCGIEYKKINKQKLHGYLSVSLLYQWLSYPCG